MIKRIIEMFAFCVLILFLASCGGGGGGGGGGLAPSVSFVNWSSVDPPVKLNMTGCSQETNFTATRPTPDTFQMTSLTDLGVLSPSTASLTYRSDGSIERISINTPNTSVVWDETTGQIIRDGSMAVLASDNCRCEIFAIINGAHPDVGWEYQTFGVWRTGRRDTSGSIGAMSIGVPTTGSNIPTTGDATFTGIAAGIYLNAAGTTDYITAGDLRAEVDFLNRSIDLTINDTNKTNIVTNNMTDASNLDMTGTLTYADGVNSFTGTVNATGGMSGTSTGEFYGPNAEELGGSFSLSGDDFEHYTGGYGAQR